MGPIGKGVFHAHRRQFLSGLFVQLGRIDSFHENGLFLQQVGGLLLVVGIELHPSALGEQQILLLWGLGTLIAVQFGVVNQGGCREF